jgi:predicted component of type VI protein secretion system
MSLGGPQQYKLHLPPPKLKLRVFSVSKSSNPDLHCCQHEEQEIVIGRSPNCDIRIDDELLSKMQATIFFNQETREWIL